MTLSAAGGAERAGDPQGRLVFVVSESDERRFVRTAEALARDAPEPSALVTDAGSAHGRALFASDHGDDFRGRLRAFLAVCGS